MPQYGIHTRLDYVIKPVRNIVDKHELLLPED